MLFLELTTYAAKLLNADWLRERIFFLNHQGTFLEIKSAWLLDADWLSTPALRSLGFPLKADFEKGFQKPIASEFASHCF